MHLPAQDDLLLQRLQRLHAFSAGARLQERHLLKLCGESPLQRRARERQPLSDVRLSASAREELLKWLEAEHSKAILTSEYPDANDGSVSVKCLLFVAWRCLLPSCRELAAAKAKGARRLASADLILFLAQGNAAVRAVMEGWRALAQASRLRSRRLQIRRVQATQFERVLERTSAEILSVILTAWRCGCMIRRKHQNQLSRHSAVCLRRVEALQLEARGRLSKIALVAWRQEARQCSQARRMIFNLDRALGCLSLEASHFVERLLTSPERPTFVAWWKHVQRSRLLKLLLDVNARGRAAVDQGSDLYLLSVAKSAPIERLAFIAWRCLILQRREVQAAEARASRRLTAAELLLQQGAGDLDRVLLRAILLSWQTAVQSSQQQQQQQQRTLRLQGHESQCAVVEALLNRIPSKCLATVIAAWRYIALKKAYQDRINRYASYCLRTLSNSKAEASRRLLQVACLTWRQEAQWGAQSRSIHLELERAMCCLTLEASHFVERVASAPERATFQAWRRLVQQSRQLFGSLADSDRDGRGQASIPGSPGLWSISPTAEAERTLAMISIVFVAWRCSVLGNRELSAEKARAVRRMLAAADSLIERGEMICLHAVLGSWRNLAGASRRLHRRGTRAAMLDSLLWRLPWTFLSTIIAAWRLVALQEAEQERVPKASRREKEVEHSWKRLQEAQRAQVKDSNEVASSRGPAVKSKLLTAALASWASMTITLAFAAWRSLIQSQQQLVATEAESARRLATSVQLLATRGELGLLRQALDVWRASTRASQESAQRSLRLTTRRTRVAMLEVFLTRMAGQFLARVVDAWRLLALARTREKELVCNIRHRSEADKRQLLSILISWRYQVRQTQTAEKAGKRLTAATELLIKKGEMDFLRATVNAWRTLTLEHSWRGQLRESRTDMMGAFLSRLPPGGLSIVVVAWRAVVVQEAQREHIGRIYRHMCNLERRWLGQVLLAWQQEVLRAPVAETLPVDSGHHLVEKRRRSRAERALPSHKLEALSQTLAFVAWRSVVLQQKQLAQAEAKASRRLAASEVLATRGGPMFLHPILDAWQSFARASQTTARRLRQRCARAALLEAFLARPTDSRSILTSVITAWHLETLCDKWQHQASRNTRCEYEMDRRRLRTAILSWREEVHQHQLLRVQLRGDDTLLLHSTLVHWRDSVQTSKQRATRQAERRVRANLMESFLRARFSLGCASLTFAAWRHVAVLQGQEARLQRYVAHRLEAAASSSKEQENCQLLQVVVLTWHQEVQCRSHERRMGIELERALRCLTLEATHFMERVTSAPERAAFQAWWKQVQRGRARQIVEGLKGLPSGVTGSSSDCMHLRAAFTNWVRITLLARHAGDVEAMKCLADRLSLGTQDVRLASHYFFQWRDTWVFSRVRQAKECWFSGLLGTMTASSSRQLLSICWTSWMWCRQQQMYQRLWESENSRLGHWVSVLELQQEGSRDMLLLRSVLSAWYRSTMVSRRSEDARELTKLASERARLWGERNLILEQSKHRLSHLLSGLVLSGWLPAEVVAAFGAWREVARETRRQRRSERAERQDASRLQLADFWMSSQSHGMLCHLVFSAWRQAVAQAHLQHHREQLVEQDASRLRLAELLLSLQCHEVLSHVVLTAWRQVVARPHLLAWTFSLSLRKKLMASEGDQACLSMAWTAWTQVVSSTRDVDHLEQSEKQGLLPNTQRTGLDVAEVVAGRSQGAAMLARAWFAWRWETVSGMVALGTASASATTSTMTPSRPNTDTCTLEAALARRDRKGLRTLAHVAFLTWKVATATAVAAAEASQRCLASELLATVQQAAASVTARLTRRGGAVLLLRSLVAWRRSLEEKAESSAIAQKEEEISLLHRQRHAAMAFAASLHESCQGAVTLRLCFVQWRQRSHAAQARRAEDEKEEGRLQPASTPAASLPAYEVMEVFAAKASTAVLVALFWQRWRMAVLAAQHERDKQSWDARPSQADHSKPTHEATAIATATRAATQAATALVVRLEGFREWATVRLLFEAWHDFVSQGQFVDDIMVLQQQLHHQAAKCRHQTLALVQREEVLQHASISESVFRAWQLQVLVQASLRSRQTLLRHQSYQRELITSALDRWGRCRANAFMQTILSVWKVSCSSSMSNNHSRPMHDATLMSGLSRSPQQQPPTRPGFRRHLESGARAWSLRRMQTSQDFRVMARALSAWQRHLLQVSCARSIQIAEIERDDLLRRLQSPGSHYSYSHSHSHSHVAASERSMSAALIARALEF